MLAVRQRGERGRDRHGAGLPVQDRSQSRRRLERPADQGLRLGGPVEPVRAFLLHDQSQWDPLAEDVAPGAFLTASLEGVRRVSDNRFGGAGRNYLVFLGYAETVLPPTRGLRPHQVGGAHVLRAVPEAG